MTGGSTVPVTVDVPDTIALSRVQQLLHDLGLGDLDDLISLTIGVDGVYAEVWARHPEHGGRYAPPGSATAATHVISIALDRDA